MDEPSSRLPLRTIAAFGLPVCGASFLLFFVQFYFLKFATDVLLIAPGAVGLLFGLGRIWDAVTDPLVGLLSDRTRTRLGRRRPWLFAALVPLALLFVMVWVPPADLSGTAAIPWVAVALFGFYTALTMYQVPHTSLGTELTDDYHDRSRVFGAQAASFTLGMLLSFAAIQAVSGAAEPRAAAATVAVATSLAAIALLAVCPLLVGERPELQGRPGTSALGALRDVGRNPHARVLFAAWFVLSFGNGSIGVLAPYMAEYVLGRPDQMAALPAFFVVSSVLSIPLWLRIAPRLGKRNCWRLAMGLSALTFGGTLLVDEESIDLFRLLLVLGGAAGGCGQMLGPSILADVIDADEHATGERKEGAYAATWGFVLKLAIGLQIMLTGVLLQASGFVPNVAQSEETKLALRLLFGGMPMLFSIGGALLLARFALDEREHARIRAALAERRGAASAA